MSYTIIEARWGDRVVAVKTCNDPAQCAAVQAQWPGGVVDLARLLDPARPDFTSMASREWFARMAFVLLGEPLPGAFDGLRLGAPSVTAKLAGAAPASPVVAGQKPAAFGVRRSTRLMPEAPSAPPRVDLFAEITARAQRAKEIRP